MKPESTNLAVEYDEAVAHERDAWHALHACAAGSEARARAWTEWTDAITRTNSAWRKLSARQLGQPHGIAFPQRTTDSRGRA
jgi:hypothetical protein